MAQTELHRPSTIWTTLVVALLMVACSTPTARQVEAVDSSQDTVQFIFQEEMPDDTIVRGIVECQVLDGSLENCRKIDAEYR